MGLPLAGAAVFEKYFNLTVLLFLTFMENLDIIFYESERTTRIHIRTRR